NTKYDIIGILETRRQRHDARRPVGKYFRTESRADARRTGGTESRCDDIETAQRKVSASHRKGACSCEIRGCDLDRGRTVLGIQHGRKNSPPSPGESNPVLSVTGECRARWERVKGQNFLRLHAAVRAADREQTTNEGHLRLVTETPFHSRRSM